MYRKILMTAALATLVSACGSGDDENDRGGPVPITGRSDVIREAANVASIADVVVQFTDDTSTIARKAAARGGTEVRAATHSFSAQGARAALLARTEQAMVRPKATTVPCGIGGSYLLDQGSKSFTFDFYGQPAQTVDYQAIEDRDCRDNNNGELLRRNGFSEFGSPASGAYSYNNFGTSSNSYDVTSSDSSGSFTSFLQFESQNQHFSDGLDMAVLGDVAVDATDSAGRYQGDFFLGNGSAPFRVQTDAAGSVFGVDGRYDYQSTLCSGGTVDVTTLTNLVRGNDDSFVGGSIKVQSENGAATIIFDGTGGGSYSLANGSSGSFSRGEFLDAYDGC